MVNNIYCEFKIVLRLILKGMPMFYDNTSFTTFLRKKIFVTSILLFSLFSILVPYVDITIATSNVLYENNYSAAGHYARPQFGQEQRTPLPTREQAFTNSLAFLAGINCSII